MFVIETLYDDLDIDRKSEFSYSVVQWQFRGQPRGRKLAFDDDRLSLIYDRTNGRCHLCRKKLCFCNYGKCGRKGAWEVDHSRSRARGGNDHLNNLYAACICCNRRKQECNSSAHRHRNGFYEPPLSKTRLQAARKNNTAAGAIVGGLLGLAAGPIGAIVGSGLGAWLGSEINPES